MISGIIKLFTSEGKELESELYLSRHYRESMVVNWMGKHWDEFQTGCYIEISPDVKHHQIRKNGMNYGTYYQREERKAYKPKPVQKDLRAYNTPFVRPKAEYGNKRSLYGLNDLP